MKDDKLLRIESLNTWFYTEGGVVKALEDVSFSVASLVRLAAVNLSLRPRSCV